MARIAIAAIGSRGDVAPFTDFGCRLKEAGHEVVVAAVTEYADSVSECGLEARSVEFAVSGDIDLEANPMKIAKQAVSPKGMLATGRNLLAALDDVRADVLLLSPFAELAGHPLAEARNIPSIGVRLQPMSTTAEFPPSLMGGWSAGSMINRAAGRRAAGVIDRMYGKTIAAFREQLDLPRMSAKAMRRQRTDAEWPILHGFSPSVVPRPADWRPGLEVTGYWWPQQPIGWEPPHDLVSFLESGLPPVIFGLGSLIVTADEAARISEIASEALRKVGVRGVVQAGGAALDAGNDNQIITVGGVPHDWLFGKAAAVVHSCGAGTMAAGLRAGLPAVAVPSPGGDQLFWSRRLAELGVSSATVQRPKLTADKLAAAIDSALTEQSHRDSAEQLAARIAAEAGAGAVVDAVERLVRV
ncbi:glycosyltransferase [Antrihabitans cavernicola]|uniref:Glycosyltransferase family 1 protein n=1 Tax=Antrihabitans cavernicola TaxID=2495913 RepID=A0A5A7S541_9NOCA|nr:glycosyltransferase family 1 protein [Spelaeibacter cavernicola]